MRGDKDPILPLLEVKRAMDLAVIKVGEELRLAVTFEAKDLAALDQVIEPPLRVDGHSQRHREVDKHRFNLPSLGRVRILCARGARFKKSCQQDGGKKAGEMGSCGEEMNAHWRFTDIE